MTINNALIKHEHWRRVKSRIIHRLGTVREAARRIGCHPNAIRFAVEGRCPKVKAKLEELLS